MDWYKMAIFLYCAALTHSIADFSMHRWRSGIFVFLHAGLYAICYIPLFWWLDISVSWLILIFLSHAFLDSIGAEWIQLGIKVFLRGENDAKLLKYIGFGIDQILHLLVPLIIALLSF